MLMRRRYDKEIMDDHSIADERIVRALDELRVINTFLGGKSVSTDGILSLSDGADAKGIRAPLSLLDIGSGGSDTLTRFSDAAPYTIISMDINQRVCEYVRAHDPDAAAVCANVLSLPVRPSGVDIVHASLFLHHFTETEIEQVLGAALDASRLGVVVNDLRRSVLAFAGIWILTRIFPASPMVRHDGPLSVKRGFSRDELETILRRLPASSYTIRRRWAFRWLVIIKK
jgi:hypothetical protein